MAIKGKRRTRGGRSVASAPKPKLVVVKPPLFQRTWFRVTLVVVLVALVGGVVAGVVQSRRSTAAREEAQEEVLGVGVQIENAMVGVGQALPDGTVIVLPEISRAISQIESGEERPRRIRNQSEEWAERAQSALATLEAVETDNPDLRRALDSLALGLSAYGEAARSLPEALDLAGQEQRRFLSDLRQQLDEGQAAVSSGILIYLNQRVDVGLEGENPPQPGVQTMLPGQNPFAPPGPGDLGTEPAPQPTG